MVAVNVLLANGLAIPLIDPLGGAVGSKNQQRNLLKKGFGNSRCKIISSRSRGANQYGWQLGLLSHAQPYKGRTALVTYRFGGNFWVRSKCQCERGAP